MSRACRNEDGATEAETAPQDGSPEPRKRGRPKGQPKTGGRTKAPPLTAPQIRDALLGKSNAIEELCKIAKGEQMRWSGPTGKVVWRYPTAQEQISAIRLIIDKTVPTLQATQISGDPEQPLFPVEHDSMDLARAVLGVLREANPGANVAVYGSDQHIARFNDPDLGKRLLGDDDTPAGKFPEFEPASQPELDPVPTNAGSGNGVAAPSGPPPAPQAEPDERILVGDRGCFISLRERRGPGQERWGIFSADGTMQRARWCDRAEAERICREIEAGQPGFYDEPRQDNRDQRSKFR